MLHSSDTNLAQLLTLEDILYLFHNLILCSGSLSLRAGGTIGRFLWYQ